MLLLLLLFGEGKNEAKKGDIVRITETRPLSKTKHFRVVEIVEKAVIK